MGHEAQLAGMQIGRGISVGECLGVIVWWGIVSIVFGGRMLGRRCVDAHAGLQVYMYQL